MIVICQPWTESERGWGRRSDGYSLHLTEQIHKNYVAKGVEGNSECYSFPDGEPYNVNIKANSKLAKELSQKKSLRIWGEPPEGFRKVNAK